MRKPWKPAPVTWKTYRSKTYDREVEVVNVTKTHVKLKTIGTGKVSLISRRNFESAYAPSPTRADIVAAINAALAECPNPDQVYYEDHPKKPTWRTLADLAERKTYIFASRWLLDFAVEACRHGWRNVPGPDKRVSYVEIDGVPVESEALHKTFYDKFPSTWDRLLKRRRGT